MRGAWQGGRGWEPVRGRRSSRAAALQPAGSGARVPVLVQPPQQQQRQQRPQQGTQPSQHLHQAVSQRTVQQVRRVRPPQPMQPAVQALLLVLPEARLLFLPRQLPLRMPHLLPPSLLGPALPGWPLLPAVWGWMPG